MDKVKTIKTMDTLRPWTGTLVKTMDRHSYSINSAALVAPADPTGAIDQFQVVFEAEQ